MSARRSPGPPPHTPGRTWAIAGGRQLVGTTRDVVRALAADRRQTPGEIAEALQQLDEQLQGVRAMRAAAARAGIRSR